MGRDVHLFYLDDEKKEKYSREWKEEKEKE